MKKIIHFLFYILFFFTPLLLNPKTSEVFEFNKMIFVYLLTILISFFWLTHTIQEKKFTLARTPLDIPILLFLISQIISTIFSIDPHTSIYGYYSRFHGGLASTICYIILFYAIVTHITHKELSFLLYSIMGSSFLIATYAILEHFGIDKDMWVQDVQNRVFSTLGQPNWLSAYLIAILPIPLHLSTKNPKKTLPVYLILSFLIFIAILFSKSQSGIATTFIILTIFFLTQIKSTKSKTSLIKPIITFILLSLIIGTPWTPNPNQLRESWQRGGPLWPYAEKYLQKINLTTQIKPIDESTLTQNERDYLEAKKKGVRFGGSDSMEIRSVVWQGAIELVKRHPLFGTGVETFGYSYFWTRPVHHNILSEWDFLYNKAHNEYLNFATTTGLFGIFTYILLIISILKLFAKTSIVTKPTDKITVRTLVKTNNNSDQKINLSHPLFLGFLSILITNFFGFSVVNIALFFFLFPAIIITSDTKPDKFLILSLKIIPYYPTLLLLTLLTLYSLNSIRLLYISDLNYNQGKNHLLTSSLKPALDSLTLAHNQNPKEPVFTATLAETEAQAAASLAQELKTLSASDSSKYKETFSSSIKQYLNNYENHISLTLSQNPYHTNFYKSKAKSEIYLSTIDSKYLSQAADTMLHLTTLTPTDAKTYYSLGIIYLNLKRSDLAITNLKKAIDLKPDYDQAKELLKNLN